MLPVKDTTSQTITIVEQGFKKTLQQSLIGCRASTASSSSYTRTHADIYTKITSQCCHHLKHRDASHQFHVLSDQPATVWSRHQTTSYISTLVKQKQRFTKRQGSHTRRTDRCSIQLKTTQQEYPVPPNYWCPLHYDSTNTVHDFSCYTLKLRMVQVLQGTRHKTGHFRDALPSQSLD